MYRYLERNDSIVDLMHSDPEKALQEMYELYYSMLCNAVYFILKDRSISEDIVQEVFVEVWKKMDKIQINQSFASYLRRSCTNRALNYLRDNSIKWEDESSLYAYEDSGFTSEQYNAAELLEARINETIEKLPEKCGIIFGLSRFEEMSYAQIAKHLDISIKTVENQISKALKILREDIYKNNDNE